MKLTLLQRWHGPTMEVSKALKIFDAAKTAGADAIGIYITDMESYMVPHYGSGKSRVSSGKEHLQISIT